MRNRLGFSIMDGAMAQREQPAGAPEEDQEQDTSDFGVLTLDLSLNVELRTAPDPLRAAPPERLEPVRRAVRNIVAARRASTEYLPGA